MKEPTLESIRTEMGSFLDIYKEFDDIAKARYIDREERIALFGIYMSSVKQR